MYRREVFEPLDIALYCGVRLRLVRIRIGTYLVRDHKIYAHCTNIPVYISACRAES